MPVSDDGEGVGEEVSAGALDASGVAVDETASVAGAFTAGAVLSAGVLAAADGANGGGVRR